jgi:hypothetical protein
MTLVRGDKFSGAMAVDIIVPVMETQGLMIAWIS